MRLRLLSAALLLLSTALCAQKPTASPAANTQTPEDLPLHVTTRNVLLDITVLDKENHPVTGLGKEHFTVIEDGKPQQILSFEEAGTKPPPQLPKIVMPPHVYSNIPSIAATSSLYVILLDMLNTAISDQMYARSQVVNFLKKLPQGSRIAIFGLSDRLYLLQGFTSDPAVLQSALNRKRSSVKQSILMDDPGMASLTDMMADMSADSAAASNLTDFLEQQQFYQNEARIQRTLDAFDSLALYLSILDGRKNVIWFAGNFPLNLAPDLTTSKPLDTLSIFEDDVHKTSALLVSKRITVYPVDAKGLISPPMFSAATSGQKYARNPSALGNDLQKQFNTEANTHIAMEDIAAATGGRAFYNTNGLDRVLRDVMEIGKNYYSLAYAPNGQQYDDRFHKIAVKLDVPGYKLLYRTGYYATAPVGLEGAAPLPNADPTMTALMRGTPDTTQIPFKIRVVPVDPQPDTTNPESHIGDLGTTIKGPVARFAADWALDETTMQFQLHKDDNSYTTHFRLVLAAYDADGKLLNVTDQSLTAKFDKERYLFYREHGLQYHQEIDLPKGEVFLRTAVFDLANNHSGATEIPLIVNPMPKKLETAPAKPAPAPAPAPAPSKPQ